MRMHNAVASCLVSATACLVLANVAMANGPFGLTMGMSKEELGTLESTRNPDMYKLEDVPIPSDHFDDYYLMVGDEVGLCVVRTVKGPIDSNRFGHGIKREYEQLQDALVKRYGKGEDDIDMLMPGSLWDEPEDFMMGLQREDRQLFTLWTGEANAAMAASSLSAILLEAKGLSSSKGALVLQYEFDNAEACRERSRELKNKGL